MIDEDYKISRHEIESAVNDFLKKGGKITIQKPEVGFNYQPIKTDGDGSLEDYRDWQGGNDSVWSM